MLLANSACVHIKVVQPLQGSFLVFFSISQIKHALPYVTDRYRPLQSLILINKSAAVFMALQVALCIAKIRLTSEGMYACSSFCLISRLNMFLHHAGNLSCNADMTLLDASTWISTLHESRDRNLAQHNTRNCLTVAVVLDTDQCQNCVHVQCSIFLKICVICVICVCNSVVPLQTQMTRVIAKCFC